MNTTKLNFFSGSLDGVYTQRNEGSKNQPASERIPDLKSKVKLIESSSHVYNCPSFTDDAKSYQVDMEIGVCSCFVGYNGKVCKHQYFLVANNIATSANFIPYTSASQRQKCAFIAIGKSLPEKCYEGIHPESGPDHSVERSALEHSPINQSNVSSHSEENCEEDSDHLQKTKKSEVVLSSRNSIEVVTSRECKKALENTITYLLEKIDCRENDVNFLNGIVKFCETVQKYPTSKLTNAFHTFGKSSYLSLKGNTTPKSNTRIAAKAILSKVKGGKIPVQPGSVQRRKTDSGSRNSIIKGMTKKKNPLAPKKAGIKRPHAFAKNVTENVPVPKKAGRSMQSKTRIIIKDKKSS